MANRYPLILNQANLQIQEIAAGDNLNLTDVDIVNVGNIVPSANITFDLGNSTNYWNNLYLAGNTIYLGNLQLKEVNATTFGVFTSDGTTQADLDVANVDVAAISQGTTIIGIDEVNGNAYITVAGTSNVILAQSSGVTINGTVSATGNATFANINVNTIKSEDSSFVTFEDGISVQQGVNATGNVSGGNLTTTGLASVTGNVTGGNLNTAGLISATGNITGGNLRTAGDIDATTGTIGTLDGTTADFSGNIDGGNLNSDAQIVATGNITGGNLITAGVVTASGNVQGNYFIGNGSQLSGIDTTLISNGTSEVKVVSSGGNIRSNIAGATVMVTSSAGVEVTGTFDATGNVSSGNIGTGVIDASEIYVSTFGSIYELAVDTNIDATGDITATGNVSGGNLNTAGNITGSYIFGNGSQLSGIDTTLISNGTSEVKVVSSGGNIRANVAGATVLLASSSGVEVTGIVSATGNVSGGNITTVGVVSATGNVTGGNISTAGLISATGNISGGNVSGTRGAFTNIAGTLETAAQPNITSVGTLTSLSVTGNISGGNLSGTSIGGTLTTAAQTNITSLGTLTSLTVNGIATHTGNIDVTGNINVTGNLNYQNVTDLVVGDPLVYFGANNTGNLYDLGYVVAWDDGLYQHGGIVRDATDGVFKVFGNVVAEPTTTVDFTNAIYQPFRSGAATFAGANINGALSGATTITASGNISGGNVSGTRGAFTNVAGTLETASQTNITSVGTLGSLTVTGNISGGNVSGTRGAFTNVAGTLETASQPNITTVGTLGALTVTGNVSGGNLNTGGKVVATGNIQTSGTFIGSGAGLTNVPAGTGLENGTSNVRITTSGGDVLVSVNGTANTVTFGVGKVFSGGFFANPKTIADSSITISGGINSLIIGPITLESDITVDNGSTLQLL